MHTAKHECAYSLAALAGALVALPSPAAAQDIDCSGAGEFPCNLQLEDIGLQKVPAVFKFQSRVSQAKLPVGEGVFQSVIVKLLRGTEALCLEQFENVQVRDSVLNLSIGRNMSCELDQVIAENTDLSFQICLGGSQNCLKPVALGASPYAVKSSYASVAQTAHEANVAGQAHYAHRVTADRDLFIRNKLGTGYFDFYTHPYAGAADLYATSELYEPYADGGYLQWTPVRDRGAYNLHIVGKTTDDVLRKLDRVVVASGETHMLGHLTVNGHGTFQNGGGVALSLIGVPDGSGPALPVILFSGNGGELVSRAGYVEDGVWGIEVNGHRTLEAGIDGLATLHGHVTVTGDDGPVVLTLSADADNDGEDDLPKIHFDADAGATAAELGFLEANGDVFALTRNGAPAFSVDDAGFTIASDAEVSGALTVSPASDAAGLTITRGGLAVLAGGMSIAGNSNLTGELSVTGPVTFLDTVTFQRGSIDINQPIDDRYVKASGETRDVTLSASLTVNGGLTSALAIESVNGYEINDKSVLSGAGTQLNLGSGTHTAGVVTEAPHLKVDSYGQARLTLAADRDDSSEGEHATMYYWQDGGRVGLEAGFSSGLDDWRVRVPSITTTTYDLSNMTEALRIDAEGSNAGKVAMAQGLVVGSTDVSKLGGSRLHSTGQVVVEDKVKVGTTGTASDWLDVQVTAAADVTGASGLSIATSSSSQGAVRIGVTANEAFIMSRNSKPLVLNSANNVQLATGGGKVAIGGAIDTSYLLAVRGNTRLYGTLESTGAATLNALTVSTTSTLTGAVTMSNNLSVAGTSTLTGAVSAASTLGVTGATTLSSTLGVTGATTLSSTLGVTGATTLGNAVTVGRGGGGAALVVDAQGWPASLQLKADNDANNNNVEPAVLQLTQNSDEHAYLRVRNGSFDFLVEDAGQTTGQTTVMSFDVRENNATDTIGELTGGWLKDNWLTNQNADATAHQFSVELGAVLIQASEQNCTGSGSGSITYPIAFDSGTVPVVTVSILEPGDDNALILQSASNTAFSWELKDAGSNSTESGESLCYIYWIAMGKKS
jgi:hypothetical protein